MADTVNKMIVSALRPFDLPIAEALYEGSAKEFFTYNIALDFVADTGDDLPQAYVASIQVHYICPWEQSYTEMKERIRKRLICAGATPPDVKDVSDPPERIRHLVFEFELINDYALEE